MFSKIKNLIKTEKSKKEENPKNNSENDKIQNKDSPSVSIQSPPSIIKFNYSNPDLKKYSIPGLKSAYYFPSLISEESEITLLNNIYSPDNKLRWINLTFSSRRLQKYGGEVAENGLKNQEDLPDFLFQLADFLMENKFFPPKEEKSFIKLNHCLINEYLNGTGIMPHTDGPLYYPYVLILSLGSHCSFNFYKNYSTYKSEEPIAKLLIEPRSLFIFTEECYSEYLHCIEDKQNDDIFIKFNEDKKIKDSNIANIELTDLWRYMDFNELTNKFSFETLIKRNKRISITIRHVPIH